MNGLPPIVERMVALAISEDLGNGDVTTRLTAPEPVTCEARVIARESLVVSGGDVFELAVHSVDPGLAVTRLCQDGTALDPDETLLRVTGDARSVLMAERVALNFLQRLSGVATLTRRFVERLPEAASTVITDTRKTTPGMRFLERRAVIHGGGRNHRPDLGGGILIKENHIRAAAPHPLKVEVEVTNDAELREALDAGAEVVLLDNMTLEEVRRSVDLIDGRVLVEVSGGVSLETVEALARTGVDIISVGALTHSYPSADLSLLLDETP